MSKLFGWCLPGMNQHEICKTEFDWNGTPIKCECECHIEKETEGESE